MRTKPYAPRQRWRWWDPLQRAAFLWPLVGVPFLILVCLLIPFDDPCNAWTLAAIVVVFVPVFFFWDWGRQRLYDRLKQHDYKLCLRCGYHLSGLPDEGTCPECAEPYNTPQVQETWRLRLHTPDR